MIVAFSKLSELISNIFNPTPHILTYSDCVTGLSGGSLIIHRYRYRRWLIQEFRDSFNFTLNEDHPQKDWDKRQDGTEHARVYAKLTHQTFGKVFKMIQGKNK